MEGASAAISEAEHQSGLKLFALNKQHTVFLLTMKLVSSVLFGLNVIPLSIHPGDSPRASGGRSLRC